MGAGCCKGCIWGAGGGAGNGCTATGGALTVWAGACPGKVCGDEDGRKAAGATGSDAGADCVAGGRTGAAGRRVGAATDAVTPACGA